MADVVDIVLALGTVAVAAGAVLVTVIVTSGGGSQIPAFGVIVGWVVGGLGLVVGALALLVGEFTGRGPGRHLTRIRLVTTQGQPPGLRQGVPRALIRTLFVAILALDLTAGLVVLVLLLGPTVFGDDGRGLHDRLLGTAIVGVEHLGAGHVAPTAASTPSTRTPSADGLGPDPEHRGGAT